MVRRHWENYPEMDHPFIIRHLLIGDALTEYQAHDDMIFNFYDLRRLFLHKNKLLSPLRTMSTLNAIGSDEIMKETLPFTSTHLERKDHGTENEVSANIIFFLYFPSTINLHRKTKALLSAANINTRSIP